MNVVGFRKTVVVTECDHDAFREESQMAELAGIDFRVEQSTSENLVGNCKDADGILVQYASIDSGVLDQLPRLQAIGRYGVGVDSVDIDAATKRGVAVCNVPDYGTEAVSDHAIGLALSVARGIPRLDRGVRAGEFALSAVRPLYQTRDRIFGVIGLGRIGEATARKAKGLGYQVVGWDVLATPGEEREGVSIVSLDELLTVSQVISLHIPLTSENRGLIGQSAFQKMRSDAILVNTARGGIIDDYALVQALQEKRIGGAGIDCHNSEPLSPDHPLTKFDNVVLTPHLAWYTEESYGELKRRTMEGVVEVLQGRVPRNIVNPEVLSK